NIIIIEDQFLQKTFHTADLAKNTAILSFGKICTQCISFLMLPLYTAVLDAAEYGTFDLLVTYGTLLLPLVNWQFDQGIFRFMLDCRGNKEEQSNLFSSVLFANILQSAIYAVLLTAVINIFNIKNGYFLLAYVVLHVFTALLMQFARGLGKNGIYAVASFISASGTVLFNIITLVVLKLGLRGLFAATLSALVFTILYMCFAIRPWTYFQIKRVKKKTFFAVCRYSLPLIPNNLAWWVVNVSDRTIVSYVLGVAVNGIYTVANKFSNVFIQFYNIFNLSWTESVSLHFQDDDREEFLSEMITTMYKLFSCACLGIVACMPFIFPIMINERYADAYPQIIILMYAMLLRVVVGLYSCVYIAEKDSKKVAYTSVASAAINIVVHVLLINRIGLYAASISTLVAFGVMAVIRYIDINKNVLSMKISKGALVSSLLLACVLAVTYYMNQTIVNVVMLLAVCAYALVMNWEFAKSALRMGKDCLKKLRH
ncbi:MAG: oligosaccharide flippase family protein, partial [Clostridiales bacterium]|nr:oligosaccharide flippase family protein [Clostridiales bacterium]